MNLLALLNVEKFLIFTLVLTRTSGLLIASPIFGTTQAPATVRALIALALAVLIMPSQWSATLPYPGSLLVYVVVIGGELLIGLVLGTGNHDPAGRDPDGGRPDEPRRRTHALRRLRSRDVDQRAALLAVAGPAEHGPVPDHRRASHRCWAACWTRSAPSRPAEAWRCSSALTTAVAAPRAASSLVKIRSWS